MGRKLKYAEADLLTYAQHMQRWCNNRRLIKAIPKFHDYTPYQNWVAKWLPVPGKEGK